MGFFKDFKDDFTKAVDELLPDSNENMDDLSDMVNTLDSEETTNDESKDEMQELLDEAAKPPPPKRRKTKPTKGSQIRRMDSKTKRGTTKKLRSGPISD